ncbi:glucooligosaccharide oxidase [Mycena rebaudengoi]|nr:glucooligosaccharide oxidase [Mycena rebaudengoi]
MVPAIAFLFSLVHLSLAEQLISLPPLLPTLLSCLTDSGLNVKGSKNPDWHNATVPFNARFHYEPAAIVYPTHASDVSKAIQCANRFLVHVSALSGGHSYAASGFGTRDGALVVNFRDMAQVSYNPSDGTALVQPGVRLGDLALALHDKYDRALAHGVCPYVGVGGHAGFGGWGFASRNWGLLIDQVVAAELVLANGTIVYVGKTQHPDLFWGIRGAVSSFGIVTQYTFKTHEAPTSVVRYSFSFQNPARSASNFTTLLRAYQNWGLTAPKELGIEANVREGGKVVEIGGYYMGTLDKFKAISASLFQATGPPSSTPYIAERNWTTALKEVNGGAPLSTIGIPDGHDTFFAKSLVVPVASPLTSAALSALSEYFTAAALPSSVSWFIQFELWGGGNSAISSLAPDATAYPHRAHLFTLQFYVRSTAAWSAQGTAFGNGLVSAITDNMQGTAFGAYANYLDPELRGWREKYYAGNYARLARIQKAVDPRGVFVKAQNIGAQDP